jgi:prepilin-type processing-associated H-X9-DG protein
MVVLFMVAATAHGELVVHQNLPLYYNNGSYVVLPAGTYGNLTKNANVWYLDGNVFPSPIPTAAPVHGLSATSIEMGVLLGVGGAIVVILLLALYFKDGKSMEANK